MRWKLAAPPLHSAALALHIHAPRNHVRALRCAAILVMTMALAVAMVACSGAVGTKGEPGPAGPAGPAGTTDPTDDPTDPPTTVEPGPVQKVTGIDDLVFNDSVDGTMDAMSQSVNIADHFYPAGLDYSYAPTDSKLVDVTLADGILTVMLKSGAMYQNNKITAKATDGTSSMPIDFHARRNRPPLKNIGLVVGLGDDATIMERPVIGGVITVWVGTMEPLELTIDPDGTIGPKEGDIPVKIGEYDADVTTAINVDDAYFLDDDGNTLSLMPEPLGTADAKKLTVTGGSKVTLVGMKSTLADEIEVKFTAMDDKGLSSAFESHVLNVKIDAAPTKVGAIGTRVIKASGDGRNAMITDVRKYFEDDRDDENNAGNNLTYYAWSDNPMYALVQGNEGNAMGKKTAAIIKGAVAVQDSNSAVELTINAVDPGEAMITVRAVETNAADAGDGDLAQWVEQTFKVVVLLD